MYPRRSRKCSGDDVRPRRGRADRVVGDRGVAEELAQEAFVRLCQHWEHIRGHDRPEHGFSEWRESGAQLVSACPRRTAGLEHSQTAAPRCAEARANTHHSSVTREALLRLPEDERAVVYLRFFGDLSVLETASAADPGGNGEDTESPRVGALRTGPDTESGGPEHPRHSVSSRRGRAPPASDAACQEFGLVAGADERDAAPGVGRCRRGLGRGNDVNLAVMITTSGCRPVAPPTPDCRRSTAKSHLSSSCTIRGTWAQHSLTPNLGGEVLEVSPRARTRWRPAGRSARRSPQPHSIT